MTANRNLADLARSAATVPNIDVAAGIMEANANFVDAVIFGPAMDPVDWSGRTAASTASLMLATVEETGGSSELNVWDLTSTTIASATPLYTVTVGVIGTSLAASMGYVALAASNSGVRFYDPHDGAWAERTVGWPRMLQSDSSPALTNNDVRAVASGFSDQPAYDPRTGGPMPTFSVAYGSGTVGGSVIKDSGVVYDASGGAAAGTVTGIFQGRFIHQQTLKDVRTVLIDPLTADFSYAAGGTLIRGVDSTQGAYSADTVDSISVDESGKFAFGTANHLKICHAHEHSGAGGRTYSDINRTYNTGMLMGDTRGAWLANSKTVDRSAKANTLTENGTVTEAAVASGAELKGYSGFTTSNYLHRAFDADFDFGTGDFSIALWVKHATSTTEALFQRSGTGSRIATYLHGTGAGDVQFSISDDNASSWDTVNAGLGALPNDGLFHHVVFTKTGTASQAIYIDGRLAVSAALSNAVGTFTDGTAVSRIGLRETGDIPATSSTMALVRVSATIPTATQIRQMYEAEKPMFLANSKCLLQSSSTDSVLDVSVDPITSKVAVTQTDSQMIWDGLAIDSTPAVNAGASEHNLLYGGDRVEINSVNLYATIAAKSLRGDLEIVRGLKAGLPAGVDLSKAKALLRYDPTVIDMSMNIKSVTDTGTGTLDVVFAIPFKSNTGYISVITGTDGYVEADNHTSSDRFTLAIKSRDVTSSGAAANEGLILLAVFGELENE